MHPLVLPVKLLKLIEEDLLVLVIFSGIVFEDVGLILELINELVDILFFPLDGFGNLPLLGWGQVRSHNLKQQPLCFNNDLVRQLQCIIMIKKVAENKAAYQEEILIVKEHVAACKFTISAGSANLLHIIFNRLGHIVVNHRLYIGLVYAHAECNGADEDPYLVGNEHLLDRITLLVGLARMVRRRIHAVLGQHRGQLVAGSFMCREDKDGVQLLEGV